MLFKINNSVLILVAMPTNKGKRNADLEAAHRRPKRGVLSVATTTTLSRRSGRGAAPTAPAAAVTGTGGAAAADTDTGGRCGHCQHIFPAQWTQYHCCF